MVPLLLAKLVKCAEDGIAPQGGSYHSHGEIQFVYKEGIVAFAGSNQIQDWIYNLDFKWTEGEPYGIKGKVHQGFLSAARDAYTCLYELGYAESLHTLAGHSFGAAIATLVGCWTEPSYLYLFSSPKVGDKDFADSYPHPACRMHIAPDLVPMLPPWPYKHVRSHSMITGIGGLNLYKNHSIDAIIAALEGK